MATSFDVIEDLALTLINDYKLDKLFEASESNFNTFCDGLLMSSSVEFVECLKPLGYISQERMFISDLNSTEIKILANFFVIAWWQRETNIASQIALKLKVNNAFTHGSEAQNFKEKQNIIDKLREENCRLINKYLADNIDKFM